MHKFFVNSLNFNGNTIRIEGEDVRHIYKVLRLKIGDEVNINNLQGSEYLAKLTEVNKTFAEAKIIEKLEKNNESSIDITLFQGLPKGGKMDLIVQKGTEIGVKNFVPYISERVIVQGSEFKKIHRLNKIILEASKQSKRSIIPTIKEPIEFDNLIDSLKDFDLIVVPYENEEGYGVKSLMWDIDKDKVKSVAIVIGPEGGFEEEEIEKLKEARGKIVTLGKRILRTETAGFVASSLILYELGDLGGEII